MFSPEIFGQSKLILFWYRCILSPLMIVGVANVKIGFSIPPDIDQIK